MTFVVLKCINELWKNVKVLCGCFIFHGVLTWCTDGSHTPQSTLCTAHLVYRWIPYSTEHIMHCSLGVQMDSILHRVHYAPLTWCTDGSHTPQSTLCNDHLVYRWIPYSTEYIMHCSLGVQMDPILHRVHYAMITWCTDGSHTPQSTLCTAHSVYRWIPYSTEYIMHRSLGVQMDPILHRVHYALITRCTDGSHIPQSTLCTAHLVYRWIPYSTEHIMHCSLGVQMDPILHRVHYAPLTWCTDGSHTPQSTLCNDHLVYRWIPYSTEHIMHCSLGVQMDPILHRAHYALLTRCTDGSHTPQSTLCTAHLVYRWIPYSTEHIMQ